MNDPLLALVTVPCAPVQELPSRRRYSWTEFNCFRFTRDVLASSNGGPFSLLKRQKRGTTQPSADCSPMELTCRLHEFPPIPRGSRALEQPPLLPPRSISPTIPSSSFFHSIRSYLEIVPPRLSSNHVQSPSPSSFFPSFFVYAPSFAFISKSHPRGELASPDGDESSQQSYSINSNYTRSMSRIFNRINGE